MVEEVKFDVQILDKIPKGKIKLETNTKIGQATTSKIYK
jgi:hypothetical protein